MSNTALALRDTETTMNEWNIIRDQASILVKTGFLPNSIKTPEQAMAIILTGKELGIGPMAALNNINVIQGKPTVAPQLMLALINRTGQLEDFSITDDGQACTVLMKRKGRAPHTESFSMKDATLMKTTEYVDGNKKTISLSEKYNWKQQPATMRKWRAVAACARVVFADVILGLYTPDEMGADSDEEGNIQQVRHTEPTSTNIKREYPDLKPVAQIVEIDHAREALKEELRALWPTSQKPEAFEPYFNKKFGKVPTANLKVQVEEAKRKAAELLQAAAKATAETGDRIIDAEVVSDPAEMARLALAETCDLKMNTLEAQCNWPLEEVQELVNIITGGEGVPDCTMEALQELEAKLDKEIAKAKAREEKQ